MRAFRTRDYLEALFHDCGIVELRHLGAGKPESGIFDSADALLAAARSLARAGNLYTTLNAPRLRIVRNQMGQGALCDADIAFIVRLPFDFDPSRPADCCSTDEELAAAVAARDAFVRRMHGRGWPLPIVAMSGNGAHAQYRVKLPANSETREAMQALYHGLRDECVDDGVDFDVTVRNPSRIFRLYGSVNRKGPDLAVRPHRQSTVAGPQFWRQVSQRQVMSLADAFARRAAPTTTSPSRPAAPIDGVGDYRTLDVVRWFHAHGHYKRPAPDGGGKHFVRCPWVHEHSSADHPAKTDTVIWQAADGWPTFHCSHAHCAGRSLRDVLAVWGDADAFCSAEWRASR